MLIPQLSTPRLILRAFNQQDVDTYADMCSNPEVMRYIGYGQYNSQFATMLNAPLPKPAIRN